MTVAFRDLTRQNFKAAWPEFQQRQLHLNHIWLPDTAASRQQAVEQCGVSVLVGVDEKLLPSIKVFS